MNGEGPGLLKFECGVAINRSATRLPISLGEVPAGHFLNSFGCCCAWSDNASTIIQAANNSAAGLRDRFIRSPLSLGIYVANLDRRHQLSCHAYKYTGQASVADYRNRGLQVKP